MSEQKKAPQDETPIQETEETKTAPTETTESEEAKRTANPKKAGKKKAVKQDDNSFVLSREQMEQMELAAKQLESAKEQYIRLTAEYDNYRKRTKKEKENLYSTAKSDTLVAILPVFDNLERSLTVEGDEDSPHKKGLEMIFNQLVDILKSLGVTKIDALGQPFDPERHNAVMHIDDENYGENEVCDVFQQGFMLDDKVLRFATVRVAN